MGSALNSEEALRSCLRLYGQEHLLRFWGELDKEQRESLRRDVQEIDLKEVTEFFREASKGHGCQEKLDEELKPVPAEVHGSAARTNSEELECLRSRGLKEISEGRVGVLLLAGGQGTRLGVDYPKGMYDVGLPSGKPLFQIQAERILKLQGLAKVKYQKPCSIAWYIMTSDATMQRTQKFFEKNNYFGLDKNNVVMFEQGMLPCFDFEGKILLERKHKIAKSPDGNGGLYRALKDRKILQDMDERGVKYLHAYCVDNILVKVADPVFVGYCVSKDADCAAKVVEKVSPDEPIGVVCNVKGKLQVVEYSEMTSNTAQRRNPDKKLMFSAGNICNHFFTCEFLKNIANEHESKLKLHIAKKKIPHVDETGNQVNPDMPNGVKIEKFVFDVFPYASNFVTWEVPREEEFSALKNSESAVKDNPRTAREDIYRLHKIFVTRAGGTVIGDGPFEVSPLLSYAGEGLESLCRGNTWNTNTPVHLCAPHEMQKHQSNGAHL